MSVAEHSTTSEIVTPGASGRVTGKRVANRTYVHMELFNELSDNLRGPLGRALEIAKLNAPGDFNVARIDLAHQEVGLLNYPSFFDDPFPTLAAAWRVHLPTEAVTYRNYQTSLNPPILHRKELLLPASHPGRPVFEALTKAAETIGLFEDPVRIGFKQQWEVLVASKGYQVVGQQLVPVGNVPDEPGEADAHLGSRVQRHLTAMSRNFLSAPVQALLRHNVLTEGSTFFDYGCGKGGDVTGLKTMGIDSAGWDPHFAPDDEIRHADIVNLGFVINVIENFDERIGALQRAYSLARGALCVAAMLYTSNEARGRKFGDGYLTSRNTFQRYYTQSDLQEFIEGVLDEQAIPVGPGIFFVFKDRFLEQRFLLRRQTDVSRAPRLIAARQLVPSALRQRPTGPKVLSPEELASLDSIWQSALELGRLPEEDEYPESVNASQQFGSWKRALRAATQRKELEVLEAAGKARADELRIFFALQAFGRRKRLGDLEPRLRRDVKMFFGSVAVAETEGRRLLHHIADADAVEAACDTAASSGLGWLETRQSLQLHTSLVARLAPILRVYVGCATALYGDVASADLVKIHIRSGKVTLMHFDDFLGLPLPRMVERVKVKLREQDLEIFEYGEQFPPPYLYFKSRFINEEFPGYAEQVEFDEALADLGIVETVGYGPSAADFDAKLRRARRQIDRFKLLPSTTIPNLDDPCGNTFSFRQLIECGKTWERTRVDNLPKSPETYNALFELAVIVLDPVVEYFGAIKLTYGFASKALAQAIKSGIAPSLDQHSSCERSRSGRYICTRRGAAVDFLVEDEDMLEVAKWIADHCQFDRIYYYGHDRPIHVSVGPELAKQAFELSEVNSRRVPKYLRL